MRGAIQGVIPFWPSRASSLSSNRSDSRGIQRAGVRSPSLSVFRFLFGSIRSPFHFFFSPLCCWRRGCWPKWSTQVLGLLKIENMWGPQISSAQRPHTAVDF